MYAFRAPGVDLTADTESAAEFSAPTSDPRRGVLWAGAAPMDAGSGRVGVGVAGGWLATWKGLQVAGGAAEVDAAWAPTRRLAFAATGAVAAGTLRQDCTLGTSTGWGGIASARWLVVDDNVRVAPFLAGGLGAIGSPPKTDPVGLVGAGVALEVPFYAITFDAAVPVGGVVVSGQLPDTLPLSPGPFAPLFLLSEAGFTWRLGPDTSFRLGYVALATSWSWRWTPGPLTVEVTGYTNLFTGNLSARLGYSF